MSGCYKECKWFNINIFLLVDDFLRNFFNITKVNRAAVLSIDHIHIGNVLKKLNNAKLVIYFIIGFRDMKDVLHYYFHFRRQEY